MSPGEHCPELIRSPLGCPQPDPACGVLTPPFHLVDPGSNPEFQILRRPGPRGRVLQEPVPGAARGGRAVGVLHPGQHSAGHQVPGLCPMTPGSALSVTVRLGIPTLALTSPPIQTMPLCPVCGFPGTRAVCGVPLPLRGCA